MPTASCQGLHGGYLLLPSDDVPFGLSHMAASTLRWSSGTRRRGRDVVTYLRGERRRVTPALVEAARNAAYHEWRDAIVDAGFALVTDARIRTANSQASIE